MGVTVNLILGSAFGVIGVFAAVLQFWLWTFPMEADPSGTDPNGRTTAPLAWRKLHRILGYLFTIIYVILMTQMVPRLGFALSEDSSVATKVHTGVGLLIGVVLLVKIVVLRWVNRLGKLLPTMGSIIMLGAIVLMLIAAPPAIRLGSMPDSMEGASTAVKTNCISCHGSSPIVGSKEDDSWRDTIEKMQRYARNQGRADPTDGRPHEVEIYLEQHHPRDYDERDEGQRGKDDRRERSRD